MDETTQNTESNESKGGAGKWIAIVVVVLLLLAVVAVVFGQPSLLNQLKRSLTKTQDQVQDVDQAAQQAQAELTQAAQEAVENVTEQIKEVDNPIVRLALAKAFANKLESVFSAQNKEDLNTVIVYVEKQPEVLIQPAPVWPAEVKAAVERLQTAIAKAKVKAVAVSFANQIANSMTKVGDMVTLTGPLQLVNENGILGSEFMLINTADGFNYYFTFTGTSAEEAMTMVGQEVVIEVKVTGDENGYVTYDVVSGPTLASEVTPSIAPTKKAVVPTETVGE